jgi:Tol biopolymer transport system component
VNRLSPIRSIYRWLAVSAASFTAACSPVNLPTQPVAINSRYTDEKPALSGSGRFLAFVSNREGSRNIMLYDLQQRQFVNLPYLNRRDAVADSPSISNTARYIVYIASDTGRPEVELYDRITGQSQILTQGYMGWVRNPSISPDGRYIVFETGRRGQWDIEVIDRGPLIELDRLDGPPAGSSPAPAP